MAKIRKEDKREGLNDPDYIFYCVGCKCDHGIWTEKKNRKGATWTFNRDMDKPTFNPSLLINWVEWPKDPKRDEKGNLILQADGRVEGTKDMVCHSFIRDGFIQYLGDCTHKFAGQTIELPEYE